MHLFNYGLSREQYMLRLQLSMGDLKLHIRPFPEGGNIPVITLLLQNYLQAKQVCFRSYHTYERPRQASEWQTF